MRRANGDSHVRWFSALANAVDARDRGSKKLGVHNLTVQLTDLPSQLVAFLRQFGVARLAGEQLVEFALACLGLVPFVLQPVLIAPVLPGETMKGCSFQSRTGERILRLLRD